jgi:LysM repeat protein
MQYFLKKALLLLLRSFVYMKRGAVWFGKKALALVERGFAAYKRTIGFFVYKIFFKIQKKLGIVRTYRGSQSVEFFGRRSTLQIVLFFVGVIVMIPHSKLYTKDIDRIPGRDTLLYKMVGPADEIAGVDEIVADISAPLVETSSGWRQHAVSVDTPGAVGEGAVIVSQDIASISSGGTAITKPTILPGIELPSDSSTTFASTRSESIYHDVQSGDTIGGIAEKYDISLATILWANDLTARSYIRPGDRLLILPVDGVMHKVSSGDTVHKIARRYDAEVDNIIEQNKLKNDGSDIVIGETLIIPGGVEPQPASTYTPTARKYTSLSSVAAPPPSVAAPAGSGYLWPTSVRTITQYYGVRHTGVDIAGPTGSPLYATRAGTVIKSQCGWNGGYGCYIIIDHGGGLHSLYGHASQLYVSVGERVVQGQTIGLMGSTGRSTGPHVHFEIRVGGSRTNPFQYIR